MGTDRHDGMWGTSDAPDRCPECGEEWFGGERLHTSDDKGIGGWEDWMYCKACGCELFYPVVHRPQSSNTEANGPRSGPA